MSTLSFDDLESIKKALHGDLPESEVPAFEQRLEEDEEFRAQYRLLYQLKEEHRRREEEKMVAFLEGEKKRAAATVVPVRPIRRWLVVGGAAAAILLLVVLFILPLGDFGNQNTITRQEKAGTEDYLQVIFDSSAGGEDYADLLDGGKFRAALDDLQERCGTSVCENRDEAYIYGLLLLYEKREYQEALNQFMEIAENDGMVDRYEDLPLQKARAYFGLGREAAARSYLASKNINISTLDDLQERIDAIYQKESRRVRELND